MAEFTDPAGNVWHPRITFSLVTRVERITGVNLLAHNSEGLKNPDNLLKTVFLSFEDEAKAAGVTLEDFQKAMDPGPAMPMIVGFNAAIAEFMVGIKKGAPVGNDEELRPTPATPGGSFGG